jgi:D-glycero-D-manno-heptose 1,7-bisphosphate phosphatase
MAKAVFFDRDGVINDTIDRGKDCIVSDKKVRFTAPWKYNEFKIRNGVSDLFLELKLLDFLVILATNQPDIRYGYLPLEEHEKIMGDIKKLPLDDFFVCLHGRDDGCECKKPKPGMLVQASKKHNIDLNSSFMVGDSENDILAAKAVGCKSVFYNDKQINNKFNSDFEAKNYLDIINLIKNST